MKQTHPPKHYLKELIQEIRQNIDMNTNIIYKIIDDMKKENENIIGKSKL